MQSDAVQLGPFLLPAPVFYTVLGTLLSLVSTIVTTTWLENRKWKRDKHDRFEKQQREAFAQALEWLEPIEAALNRASMVSTSFQQGTMTEDEFWQQYPQLVSTLATMDAPARLRYLLPRDIQPRVIEIVNGLGELRAASVRRANVNECLTRITALTNKLREFEATLETGYRQTFD